MLISRLILSLLLLGLEFIFLAHNLLPHVHHDHMDNTFTSDNHNHAHDDSVNNVDENLISFLLENHSHDNYVYPKHELFLKIKKLEFALHDSPHKIIYINPFISDFATLNLNYYQTVRQKLINQFDNSSYLLRAPPSLV